MRVAITTLGCKLNLAESEALALAFARAGHQVLAAPAGADLHVVHGCTVTAEAARQVRQLVRRWARPGGARRTVITGCYPTAAPAEAAALAGVDLVVPNAGKERLVEAVHTAFPELAAAAEMSSGGWPMAAGPFSDPLRPLPARATRALVKIEDGCNQRCAFCIIPATRGRQRSLPADEVVATVRARVAAGHREVVLTGVQISAYRDPLAPARGEAARDGVVLAVRAGTGGLRWSRPAGLAALVRRILAETAVERLRLTSIAPWDVDPELAALFADRRLCPHLHLSLQSGADATLRRMRRPYTAAGYATVLAGLRAAIPALAVTTDVIVGFPGETDAEAAESLAFVAAQGFAAIHVFPYSPRPGTAAATLAEPVDPARRAERRRAMAAVADTAAEAFAERHLGGVAEVLWERARDGRRQGLTPDYLRVEAAAAAVDRNAITATRIVGRRGAVALGEPSAV